MRHARSSSGSPSRSEKARRPCPAATVPISVTATPAAASPAAQCLELPRRHGSQDLVIVAAGQDRSRSAAGSAASAARAASDSGTRVTSISAPTPGCAAELGEIAGKTVGDVHARPTRAGASASASALRGSRHQIARTRGARLLARHEPPRAAADRSRRSSSPSAASPIVPVTTMRSPALAPVRRTILPCGTAPKAAIDIVIGPGVRDGVAAEQRAAEALRVRAEPAREGCEPGVTDPLRQRQREQEAERASRPWRRDRTGSRAAPCWRPRRADRRERNARRRRRRRSSARDRNPAAARSPRHRRPARRRRDAVASGLK